MSDKETANETANETASTNEKKDVKKTKRPLSDGDMEKVTKTTADLLNQQEKVKVKLYLRPEDRQKLESQVAAGKQVVWPYETVQINGYTYQIQRGVEVEIPESVAEVLRQADMI